MAAPYSMDLRVRVLKAWDASGDADEVAATFGVSRAWVHRLAQRYRETGSIAPQKQTKFRLRVLAAHEDRLKALVTAQPDATLAELRDALPTTAALSTLWLARARADGVGTPRQLASSRYATSARTNRTRHRGESKLDGWSSSGIRRRPRRMPRSTVWSSAKP